MNFKKTFPGRFAEYTVEEIHNGFLRRILGKINGKFIKKFS